MRGDSPSRTGGSACILAAGCAGADHRFVTAIAEILGPDRLAIPAHGVTEPVALRYAWYDDPAFKPPEPATA